MVKRLIAMLLSAAMCFAAAGCSESSSSSSKAESSSLAEESSSLPEESSSLPEESSSEPDSSSVQSPDVNTSDITPAMWKVESNGGTVYFLGSMHALNDSCYPLPKEITDAYENSDSLAVECDIYAYMDDIDSQMELAQNLIYSDGTTIKDNIDADLYDSAKQLLADRNLYNTLYDLYKPIMWAQLVELAMMEDVGINSDLGIDMQLLTQAHEEGKNIIEIESVELQNNILYNQPDELYDFMLETDVYYYEDNCEELAEMFEAWCTGDVEKLGEEEVDDDLEIEISDELEAIIENYNKQLMDDRNAGMIEKAKQMLENGDNVFYVVGAAHFIGDTGIIKGLEDAGYKVERIEYAK